MGWKNNALLCGVKASCSFVGYGDTVPNMAYSNKIR